MLVYACMFWIFIFLLREFPITYNKWESINWHSISKFKHVGTGKNCGLWSSLLWRKYYKFLAVFFIYCKRMQTHILTMSWGHWRKVCNPLSNHRWMPNTVHYGITNIPMISFCCSESLILLSAEWNNCNRQKWESPVSLQYSIIVA